jgi:glyoxylase-like metal-dependent hydrolase (beta-lactamase superfamily II)
MSSDMHRRFLSRRGFCLCGLGTAATGAWLSPAQVFAQARNVVDQIRADAARAPITVHRLRGSVSVLEGSGGNVAVLAGPDGKLLVDAGITASRPLMEAALAELGRAPITHLVNTHWHFDHTDGNEWLNESGAVIVAHENTRKHLAVAQRVEDWDFNFPKAPMRALPSELFASEKVLRPGSSTVVLRPYLPAHTDSDASVMFEEADVLHVADTYWNGVYPFIDYSTGGSIDGSIRAAEANLSAATEKTIVIPGHGPPVSNRAGLQRFRDMLVTVRDRVAKLKAGGRSLDEIVAARPTADFDEVWGGFAVTPKLFTRLVHEGV